MQNGSESISFVISSNTIGGAERVMIELANFASNEIDNVELFNFSKGTSFYKVDCNVIKYEPSFTISKGVRLYNVLRLFFWLRSHLRVSDSRSILCFGGKYNSFVILASFGLGKKVFISERSRPGISYGKLLDCVNTICYRFAYGIVAQTQKAKVYAFRKVKHKNLAVIPNPFRLPKFEANYIKVKEEIIINVGRFIPSKHQDWLVNYFDQLAPNLFRLYFLGDGKMRNSVENLARASQSSDRIVFMGNNKNIASWYKRASIFAFTSSSEGFPNALGEAMSYGCACISFDCVAGPSDLIDDGVNGFLIPVGDHDQYKAKLKLLIEDGELRARFGKNAIEKMKQFSINKIAQQFLDFILN